MRYTLFFLLLCLLFMGCSPATVNTLTERTGAQPMTASELLFLVEGHTLFLHSHHDDAYLFFDGSGRLMGKDINGSKDSGNWDVSETGELCIRMSKWWFGDMLCYQVYKEPGSNTFHLANSAGVLAYSAEHYEGDSKSLYFAAKPARKSYRKSARTSSREAPQGPSPAPSPEPEPAPLVVQPSSGYAQQDLRSSMASVAGDCPGCNLGGADLMKANLVQAKLSGTDLRGADLKMANLRRADLRNADLRNADLKYANLPGADLRGADLRGADLHGANLIRANLTGADTEGASFTDALLDGVIGLH